MKISFIGAGLVGSILLAAVFFPSYAQPTRNYHSFADWCVNRSNQNLSANSKLPRFNPYSPT